MKKTKLKPAQPGDALLHEASLRILARAMVGSGNGEAARFFRKHKIFPANFYNFLNGYQHPGSALQRVLGVERVYTYRFKTSQVLRNLKRQAKALR